MRNRKSKNTFSCPIIKQEKSEECQDPSLFPYSASESNAERAKCCYSHMDIYEDRLGKY